MPNVNLFIRSRPIAITDGALQADGVQLKAILTRYLLEWFSNSSNIKNSHPLVTKFEETIERGDLHVVHVTDKLPLCCGCVSFNQSFVTSFVAPRKEDTSVLWTSTIPHFQRYSTTFSIEYDDADDTYAILDSVEYALQWYMIPLQWYVLSQITASHQHLLDTARDCIERQLNEHLQRSA